MALGFAAFVHLTALALWVFLPKTPVLEIPVRILNIKLGEQEEVEVSAASIRHVPRMTNSTTLEKELSRSLESAAPTPSSDSVMRTLGKVVEAGRETLKSTKPLPKPEPAAQAAAKPDKAKDEPKKDVKEDVVPTPAEQTARQFVRERKFDYKPLPEAAKSGQGSVLGNSDTSQAEIMARYEQLISAWIEKFKVYPAEARANRLQGQAVVRIRIDRRGNVRYVTLDKSAGSLVLDKAVLEMIHRANPLPPVPAGYKAGDLLEFKVPISFKL